MVVEEPIIAEEITRGEVEEEDVYSGATVVLSEGGIELNEEEEVVQQVGNREEEIEQATGNREEEIEQEVGNREVEMEQDVGHREEVIEQAIRNREEVILVTDDEEVTDLRPSGHIDSPVGQMEETLATSGWMARRGVGSEDEEEEEESTLIRRPRSSRRPLTEETAVQKEKRTRGTEAEDERLRRERKRKGKEIAMKSRPQGTWLSKNPFRHPMGQ